jgi:predicted TIM-barrel fold metal-dependent hydrolase
MTQLAIDGHVHGDPANADRDPRELVRAVRARGVEAIVLIESLDRCRAALEAFGDFVVPVAFIEIDRASPNTISGCLSAGCRGVKFIRPDLPYGTRRYWRLYERLEDEGGTAVFHTGYLMKDERRETRPTSIERMRAAQIDVVARRFPSLGILMAHFSNPWWEEAWKVAWANPNVYADLSGGTAIGRSLEMWADMFAPDGALHADSACKLVFATDVDCFSREGYPFEPYRRFYDRLLDRIGAPPHLRETVYRGNAKKLFRLP